MTKIYRIFELNRFQNSCSQISIDFVLQFAHPPTRLVSPPNAEKSIENHLR